MQSNIHAVVVERVVHHGAVVLLLLLVLLFLFLVAANIGEFSQLGVGHFTGVVIDARELRLERFDGLKRPARRRVHLLLSARCSLGQMAFKKVVTSHPAKTALDVCTSLISIAAFHALALG